MFERVKDHWGKDLNVNIGRDNFDEIRYEYFRDSTVALEAFKGDVLDWRTENSAKNWATAYDFPAVKDKRVLLEEFPIRSSGVMQAFVFNTRREKFKDWRLRLAMNYAFDFEEMNKQIFFGQYKRIASYFEGTELACSGLPEGKELEILETVRDKVPAEVFTKPYTNPVGGTPENVRANLREALRLLKEAGYEVRNQKLTNVKTGEPFTIEFLVSAGDPNGERFVSFYKPSLERLGMTITIRVGRRHAVHQSRAQSRFRRHDQRLGPVALARQRAARQLGLAGGGSAGLGESRRHQGSGDRYADRSRDLRQGSRRACRRHQGARPRAVVEPLRGAAMDLRQAAHGALGSLRPPGEASRIRRRRRSRPSGGGTPSVPPRQDRANDRLPPGDERPDHPSRCAGPHRGSLAPRRRWRLRRSPPTRPKPTASRRSAT